MKGVIEMWMRLKKDIPAGEGNFWAYGIKTIKKDAPITIILESLYIINFYFWLVGQPSRWVKLHGLKFSALKLLESCTMDNRRTVFCAKRKNIFSVTGPDSEIRFCPGCGRRLFLQTAAFPYEEINQEPRRYFIYTP